MVQWNTILEEKTVLSGYTACDPLEISVDISEIVRVISHRADGWVVVASASNLNSANVSIGLLPLSCLTTKATPAATITTTTHAHTFHGVVDSSSTSEDDDEDETWVSPVSKASMSLQVFTNFVQSPKRTNSPRHQEFKEKQERMGALSTPPPLPERRSSETFTLKSPPPAVPIRRDSTRRKFLQKMNRRESLSSLNDKYKRAVSLNTGITDTQMHQDPLEDRTVLPVASTVAADADPKKKQYVNYIIDELVETESIYCGFLRTLCDQFFVPLKQQINLGHMGISREQGNNAVDVIFSNIQSIRIANQVFLENLMEREVANVDSTCSRVRSLAVAFQDVAHYLRMYSIYCKNYCKSIRTLNRFRKSNPMIDRFITKCSETSNLHPATGLETLLIKPVQRICKYPLFFRDLLRRIALSNPDRQVLEQASNLSERMAEEVNEKVKRADQAQAVVTASVRLQGTAVDLVQPQRRLILEDVVKMQHDRKLRIKIKRYVFFLFNDIILLARPDAKKRMQQIYGTSCHKKYEWGIKQITITGEKAAFDTQHGYPFYIMKSASVKNDIHQMGTMVERFKLFASSKQSRKQIFEMVEEAKQMEIFLSKE